MNIYASYVHLAMAVHGSFNFIFPRKQCYDAANEYQQSGHRRTYGMCRVCPDTR